jgi:rhodanese-related sulfurtransferase
MRILRTVGIVAAVLALANGSAWAQLRQDDAALRISIAELKKLQAAGQVVVVDVRARESYVESHIPGALSAPLEDLPAHVARLQGLKKPIVTYCA